LARSKKLFVLDTSVLLTEPKSIRSYGTNDVYIPFKVLEELDNQKKRQDTVGSCARSVIRFLDTKRVAGSLHDGVRIAPRQGKIRVVTELGMSNVLEMDVADNQIIATALKLQEKFPGKKVVVVSRDVNMRVKCDALDIPSEDYKLIDTIKESSSLYTGFKTCLVDEQEVDKLYDDSSQVFLSEEDHRGLLPNQFVMLVSNSNEKKTGLSRFIDYNSPLRKTSSFKKGIFGIQPRNKEQCFAFDLLMDPSIPIVSLVGMAGSGKTLQATAAGLLQTVGERNRYEHLIVSRPIQPLDKGIGWLPGDKNEKMMPWLAPIQDSLRYLMGNEQEKLEHYVKHGKIEIEALTYIRGRSIAKAFMILDEAQNLTRHEIKTILTRVGEGTKIVLTGDIEQIDNIYIDKMTNGLTYAIEKMKKYPLTGHITLTKGERSDVATLAAKVL